ncbi:hypothetical protein C9F11_17820 [Streptomyces sp. YIM 121038]|uniref:phosphotransferase family protein n=1 Tax=Streptomyces sp. YIM 121038 TaxID=2136401 RepID=UPI0011109393|nr:aminoglycoside phosphotransferase [Streptomyces sp. YIM 121038]QCX77216.1 hypothetical protein C9F11_17820 [Streptomyces sp. YIM 121038]
MPTERIDFADLPDTVQHDVIAHTGPLLKVETTASGFNSAISARLTTETGDVYVKGLPEGHPRQWTQGREAAVGPLLEGISPRVLWRVETGGWDLLGFEYVQARHADYAPASPDLEAMAVLLAHLSTVRAPEGVELKEAGHRLRDHAPKEALAYFAGDALLHTDPNTTNVMITPGGGARLVDWAWATRGAPWLDAGYWVVWLIAEGDHSPASAEAWAARMPAFQAAPPEAVDAFALANESVWSGTFKEQPDDWTRRVHEATKTWAAHRSCRP